MPPLSLAEPTGRYLSFHECEELALLTAQGLGVRAIARELQRDPGTISRELRRNAATRGGTRQYRATVAQWKAQTVARRPKPAKLAANPRLQQYVQARLSGQLQRPTTRSSSRSGAGSRPNSSTAAAGEPASSSPTPCSNTSRSSTTAAADTTPWACSHPSNTRSSTPPRPRELRLRLQLKKSRARRLVHPESAAPQSAAPGRRVVPGPVRRDY